MALSMQSYLLSAYMAFTNAGLPSKTRTPTCDRPGGDFADSQQTRRQLLGDVLPGPGNAVFYEDAFEGEGSLWCRRSPEAPHCGRPCHGRRPPRASYGPRGCRGRRGGGHLKVLYPALVCVHLGLKLLTEGGFLSPICVCAVHASAGRAGEAPQRRPTGVCGDEGGVLYNPLRDPETNSCRAGVASPLRRACLPPSGRAAPTDNYGCGL